MRLIKMLGLAAIAALAAMAFVGASSASADVFCLEAGHHTSECPKEKIYTGDLVGRSIKKALLLEGTTIKEECDSELLALGSTIENEGSHVGAKILVDKGAFDFTNCKGLCTTSTNENPFWILAEALTLDSWVIPDGALPSAVLSGCPFGITCLYTFTSDKVLNAVSGDTITATKVPLSGGGGLCPSSNLSFDGEWLVTKDIENGAPIYLAALP